MQQRLSWSSFYLMWFPYLLILCGVLLRFQQFWFDRSLWLDEAFLAVPLGWGSWGDLLHQPLEYSHFVPLGFLFLTKLALSIFGNNDLILRLIPFLASCFALILFFLLAKKTISAKAIPIALFLLVISDVNIYYSSELKPYISDMSIALLIWLLALHLYQTLESRNTWITVTLIGVIAVWSAYPAIFMLAAIGCCFFVIFLWKQQWQYLSYISIAGVIWVASFGLMYWLLMQGDIKQASPISQWLFTFWSEEHHAFMPSLMNKEGILWLMNTYAAFLKHPASLSSLALAGALGILGAIILFIEKRTIFFFLIMPVVITLIASYLQKYPFAVRMVLFLVPVLYLLIAEGISRLHFNFELQSSSLNQLLNNLLILVLVIAISWHTIYLSGRYIPNPRTVQEIKEVLTYFKNHRQTNDKFYTYFWAEPALRYYAPFFGIDSKQCVLLTKPTTTIVKEVDYSRMVRKQAVLAENSTQIPECLLGQGEEATQVQADLQILQQIPAVKGQRIWFIMTHISEIEHQTILQNLNQTARLLEQFEAPNVYLYLYQFN